MNHTGCIGYTINDVRGLLKSHAGQLTHAVVMHTDIQQPPLKKGQFQFRDKIDTQLSEIAITSVKQKLKFFINRFSYELYGRKSKRHNALYQPIIISTIEGTKLANDDINCHVNLALGNIPDGIDLRATIERCWLKAGGMNICHNRKITSLSTKHLYVEPIIDADNWLDYITKDGISSWLPEHTMWS